jgi:hypothetical protein
VIDIILISVGGNDIAVLAEANTIGAIGSVPGVAVVLTVSIFIYRGVAVGCFVGTGVSVGTVYIAAIISEVSCVALAPVVVIIPDVTSVR